MSKVLVVDDEMKIARLVRDYLTEAGFEVSLASSGPAAVAAARSDQPDLVVLDLGLPGMDGYEVTRAIRGRSAIPIIMLTARSEETDRIVGLELGADDYVVKPFSPRELVARVRAVLRRAAGAVTTEVIRAKDLVINIPHRTVEREDQRIELTASEFELLRALASSPGRVFTRGQLLDAIRGVSFESYERSIDAHVKNLRKKLERDPRQPVYLLTVYGVGYKFSDA
ncbi:MAG TPA: response regulator transcription factor [Acidimicrobiia bacterium]|nr:response regulator transcription factor [Acidimicrobiia bacterium]